MPTKPEVARTDAGDQPRRPPSPRTREELHRALEEAGRAAVTGWIGHPAVRPAIERARPGLSDLAAELGFDDQVTVTSGTVQLLGATLLWPDNTTGPSFPSSPDPISAGRAGKRFVRRLRALARRIAAAGAPLDPGDHGNLVAVAQLTTLEIDWSLAPAALEAKLYVLPPVSIDGDDLREGRVTVSASRHASGRARDDADAIAELLRDGGVGQIKRPYAGGRRRATPRLTLQLQAVLAELVAEFPGLTPDVLLALEGAGDHPALDRLRARIGKPVMWLPDRGTLRRNWPKP